MMYDVCPNCHRRFRANRVWFKCMQLKKKSLAAHSEAGKFEIFVDRKGKLDEGKVTRKAYELGFTKSMIDEITEEAVIDSSASAAPSDNGGMAISGFNTGAPSPAGTAPKVADSPLSNAVLECIQKGYFGPKLKTNSPVPKRAQCPICKVKSSNHICPHCHSPLTRSDFYRQYVINLAGTTSCGKSMFIGALMYQLYANLQASLGGWSVELRSQGRAKTIKDSFLNGLKSARENNVPYTMDGTVNAMSEPAIIRLQKGKKIYDFVFYDIAGEIFNMDFTTREDFNAILTGATQFEYPDFIIMLTNPRQCRGAVEDIRRGDEEVQQFFFPSAVERRNASGEIVLVDPEAIKRQNATVINNMATIIRLIHENADRDEEEEKEYVAPDHDEPYDIPVAVCLTAADMLEKVYDESEKTSKIYLKHSEFSENGVFNIDDMRARSDSLDNQFGDWGDTAFTEALKANFGYQPPKPFGKKSKPQIMYFGTSSLGDYSEKTADEVSEYKPINILDPFAWILYLVGKKNNEEFFKNDSISDR